MNHHERATRLLNGPFADYIESGGTTDILFHIKEVLVAVERETLERTAVIQTAEGIVSPKVGEQE